MTDKLTTVRVPDKVAVAEHAHLMDKVKGEKSKIMILDAEGKLDVVKRESGLKTSIKRLAVRIAGLFCQDKRALNERFGLNQDNRAKAAVSRFTEINKGLGIEEGSGNSRTKPLAYISTNDILPAHEFLADDSKRAFVASYNKVLVEGYLEDQDHINDLLGGVDSKDRNDLVELYLHGLAVQDSLLTQEGLNEGIKSVKDVILVVSAKGVGTARILDFAKHIEKEFNNYLQGEWETISDAYSKGEQLSSIIAGIDDFMIPEWWTDGKADNYCEQVARGALSKIQDQEQFVARANTYELMLKPDIKPTTMFHGLTEFVEEQGKDKAKLNPLEQAFADGLCMNKLAGSTAKSRNIVLRACQTFTDK